MAKLALTESRKQIIASTFDEFLKIGLCTEPANFDAAETAITSLYAHIGKKRPYFVRLSSPLAAELYINLLTKTWPKLDMKQLWDQLGDQLRDQLRGQLWDQLGDQLGGQLSDQLRGQLSDQLWNQLSDQLGGQLGGQLRDQLRDQLWVQLWDQLRDQLRDQLWVQLRGQLGDQLRGQLGGQLRGQLRDQLGGQLGDQLRGQLWVQLRDQLRDQLENSKLSYMGTLFYGQWDYLWPWFEGGRRVGASYDAKLIPALDAHLTIVRSCGWWYPFNVFCIVTDRPERISRDDQNRLHSETAQALLYRDGTGMFAWHGLRIPGEWITDKKSLTAQAALTWHNIEQRRAACEIVGWNNILKQLKAKTIDKDDDPMIGELLEVEIPEIGKEKFLRVLCGTGREFAMPVPPTVKTALEGNAWTYAVDTKVIKALEART